MEVLSKTLVLSILMAAGLATIIFGQTPPDIAINQENVENLETFFRENPDIYGKLVHIERLVNKTDHNATEIKILQDQVIKDMQPRIIDTCDKVFFDKHRELYDRIFVYRNSSRFYNISVVPMVNKELMDTAAMLTLYRDEMSKFVKKCIRKGAMSLKRSERYELEKRVNLSYVRTEDEIRKAYRHHSEFEMFLDVKKTFCHNIVDQWLEEHMVEMEKAFIIEQRQTFIPVKEELRKKIIHQCFIYVTIQKDYIQTCVDNVGQNQ